MRGVEQLGAATSWGEAGENRTCVNHDAGWHRATFGVDLLGEAFASVSVIQCRVRV